METAHRFPPIDVPRHDVFLALLDAFEVPPSICQLGYLARPNHHRYTSGFQAIFATLYEASLRTTHLQTQRLQTLLQTLDHTHQNLIHFCTKPFVPVDTMNPHPKQYPNALLSKRSTIHVYRPKCLDDVSDRATV